MPVTHFIWDRVSDNVLSEVDDAGDETVRYMNEPSQFGNLLSQRRNGTNSFYHFDAQGSARQLTNDAETVTDSYTYTAFGEPAATSGSTINPFLYNGTWGYYSDEETGEVYVRRRTYDPRLGRWLSTDPIGFVDGNNVYNAIVAKQRGNMFRGPALRNGLWRCQSKNPTLQAHTRFPTQIEGCCEEATCMVDVRAYRCFHESVKRGDDSDPKNFFTNVFARFRRYCGDKIVSTTYLHQVTLYPGRLIFPGGPLGDAASDYLKTIKNCAEFSLDGLRNAISDVKPPDVLK